MTSEDVHYSPDTAWFAIWTRSRQEKLVASIFDSLQVVHFLPLKSEIHRWSDRKQAVTIPLFQGYLFARLNPTKDTRLRVLNTPGVAGLVGNQAGPLPLPDYEIENIRTVITQKMQCSTYASIPIGDRVRVIRGALAGVEGTLLRAHADSKLVLSVEMIRQSVAVSICASDVEPIGAPSHAQIASEAPAIPVASYRT
jgi:transcription antitermination factor NusG